MYERDYQIKIAQLKNIIFFHFSSQNSEKKQELSKSLWIFNIGLAVQEILNKYREKVIFEKISFGIF